MFLFGLTPLEAWIVLLVSSLIPTAFLYLALGRVVGNSATLKGTFQGYTIELGGPIALYVLLLVFGKGFILPYTEISLQGHIKDVNGEDLKSYYIAPINLRPVDPNGQFLIKTSRDSENAYAFLVSKNRTYTLFEYVVIDPNNILLDGFPNEKVTKLEGPIPQDQQGLPLPAGYRMEIQQIIKPNPVIFKDGERLEIEIEHGQYTVTIYDDEDNPKAIEPLPEMQQGGKNFLPRKVNLKD